MSHFSYLVSKIQESELIDFPFRHIEIKDLFEANDFVEFINCREITVPASVDDENLFNNLIKCGYRIIPFPGSSASKREYLEWHSNRVGGSKYHSTCEGFGLTLRLTQPASPFLQELNSFLLSEEFNWALSSKFGIDLEECKVDCGIQKYLDGYEISPHPDTRYKSLTYMVNVNSNPESHNENHHTNYMQFVKERRYVQDFWEGNPNIQRCWVPWDWCETRKKQTVNNSMVAFAPANDTLHAVKASYQHLIHQRTQLYGNFWYKHRAAMEKANWMDLDIILQMKNRIRNSKLCGSPGGHKMSAVGPEEAQYVAMKKN